MSLPTHTTSPALAPPQPARRRRLAVARRDLRLSEPGGVAVVPASELDAESRKSLQSLVRNLLLCGHRRIAVDCSAVGEVDRGTLSWLVRLHENVRASRGRLWLTNLAEPVREALEARGLGFMTP